MDPLPLLDFAWPALLWALLALPLLGLAGWRLGRRRRQLARQYPALFGAGEGRPPQSAAGLLLAAIGVLVLAAARPQAALHLPTHLDTVALAIDNSGSMRADDLAPTRMEAARAAARAFVAAQPRVVRLSVVAVAGAAAVVQPPTREREPVLNAINRLEPQHGSALGTGLLIALTTVAPDARADVERVLAGEAPAPAASAPTQSPGAIVLLSDGQANTGADLAAAAKLAAAHGVRVFTIGIGTAQGATLALDGWSMRVRLDDAPLREVADITRGQYFQAADADALTAVYRTLGARLGVERRQSVEITGLVATLGALLAAIAGLWSLWRYGRVS